MNKDVVHEELQLLIKIAPFLQKSIPEDAMIAVTDTEKYLLYLPGKNINLGNLVGQPIPDEDPIKKAIRNRSEQTINVPKEVHGVSFRANGVPVFDLNGNVVGALGIGVSHEVQDKLAVMAETFATTSEELSASTEELSASAQDLATFMTSLNTAQKEMNDQVDKTEKILGFINSIATSSRILGLNAGIEAARSGEHGKGFSVVAKEITKLADSSAKSVDEIREILAKLKEKVDYIEDMVKKTSEISQQQSASTEEISRAIHNLASTAEDIEELAEKL